MLTIKAHYDGNHIVCDENIKMQKGQELIITMLSTEKKDFIDLSKYMGRGKKLFTTDANDFIKELRKDDRL